MLDLEKILSWGCSASPQGANLFSKQLCHQVVARGTPATHLTFWLGQIVCHYVLCLAQGTHAFSPDLAGWLQAAGCRLRKFCRRFLATTWSPPSVWARQQWKASMRLSRAQAPSKGEGQVAICLASVLEKVLGVRHLPSDGGQVLHVSLSQDVGLSGETCGG
jgi:hypothetical protein